MIGASEAKLEIFTDAGALSRWVAAWLLDLALAKEGTFAVCLSGGFMSVSLTRPVAMPSPGRARIGSGEMNDLCRTMIL